jgi:hypothetical protein
LRARAKISLRCLACVASAASKEFWRLLRARNA